MARWALPGTKTRSRTPSSGRKTIRLSTVSPHHRGVGEQDDRQPGGDAEPVVLHAPGLGLAQPAADRAGQPAGAVDRAVDDPGVEPPQRVAEEDAAAGPHE